MADQVSCAIERWQLCVHLNIKSIKFSEETLRKKNYSDSHEYQVKKHTEGRFLLFFSIAP